MGGPRYVSAAQADIARSISDAKKRSEHLLVLIESPDGTAGGIADSLPADVGPPRRVAGAAATRGKVGCIAERLDLEHLEGGAIVVENSQWADPTSMGRLQRLLSSNVAPVLLVLAHTPLRDEDRWWLDGLARSAGSASEVISARLDEPDEARPRELPEGPMLDLAVASRLVAIPLSVPLAAQFLGLGESDTLGIAETLVESGLLAEDRSGFRATVDAQRIKVGEARLGHLAARLARTIEQSDEDPSVAGMLYLAAGHPEIAYPTLRDSALTAQTRGAQGEAFHLARSALDAASTAEIDDDAGIGRLHLVCGTHLRAAGRSREAAEHLEAAAGLLEGSARIDALGFAAAVADDLQHPQDAERTLAIAEWEAVRQGELGKLGSLGTFRARALNRIGFAAESDEMLEKSTSILSEHGTSVQLYYSEVNRSWILFDRGQVARAETAFTHLRDTSDRHDLAGRADKEAWRARALFGVGHVDEAIEAVDAARALSSEAEIEAPIFLSDLALAEGGLAFGRYHEALEAADRALDLVTRSIPAWENVCRSYRALALLRLGDAEAAADQIDAALASTPEGANGWRMRSRCRAIELEVAAASGRSFPNKEAEDLADLLLQAEYFGWAAELLSVIAEQGRSKEVATEAVALAMQVGNPMVAARAAHAGRLWADPAAASVIRAIRALEPHLPPDWLDAWKSLPPVAAALEAPEPVLDTTAEDSDVLQRALARAGLSDETILSPAQRRSRGMVPHRRRRRRPLIAVASALGVIAIAAGTSFAVAQMNDDETPLAAAQAPTEQSAATTTPQPLALEETPIEVPVDLLFGTAPDRGDNGRSGYFDVAGPREVDGRYWVFHAADAISATPLAYGNNLLVGSADGTYQALDLTTGQSSWSLSTEDQIDASGALSTGSAVGDGEAPVSEGSGEGTVVIVGDDGIVRARDALTVTATQSWGTPLEATIKSSPVVVNGVVYVATTNGFVHALDLFTGNVFWRYPAEGEAGRGRITADLAFADGLIYAGTEGGNLLIINTDGTLHCEASLDAPIVVNPVVVDGRAYVSAGQIVRVLPAGTCQVPVTETVQYLSETVVGVAPAVVGDLIYVPNGDFLNAVDLGAVESGVSSPEEVHHWSEGTVNADGRIASPPVVARDTVYFGSEAGTAYAVDSDTGELLWEWRTGTYVRASPVVIEGAVYIASGDGSVYSVGPSR